MVSYLERQVTKDHKCYYCKRVMINHRHGMSKEEMYLSATIDHKYPRCLGGINDPDNYVIACARCNQLKASIPQTVFKIFADMVLIPYPDLPLHILRNSLTLYIMHLLERTSAHSKTMRDACTMTLLRLKDDIDEYEGKKVKTNKRKGNK